MSRFAFPLGLIGVSIISISSLVSAVDYPSTTPNGEIPGGTFNQYFSNFLGPAASCLPGQVVSGFSSSGILQCITSSGYWNSSNGGSSIYFTGTGNVGIGTNTPQAKLEIKGNGSYNDSTIATSLGGYSQKARIGPGTFGEVGITSNWYSVGNPGSALSYLDDSSRAGWDLQFGSASDAFYIHRMPPTNGGFTSGYSTLFAINNYGNVGIGTTNPQGKLHISGIGGQQVLIQGSQLVGNNYLMFNNNGINLGYIGYGSTGNNGLNLINYQNDKLSIGTNNTEMIYIQPSGNIGIGVTSPTAKLEVNGEIKVSNAISSQGGRIKRDFISSAYYGGGPGHEWDPMVAHIKTNIRAQQTNVMWRILVEGYNYGNGQPINSDIVGYNWTTGLVQTSSRDYSGGGIISQYLSSDGYLVVRMSFTSAYYVGLSVSAWTIQIPGFNITGQVYWQMTNL